MLQMETEAEGVGCGTIKCKLPGSETQEVLVTNCLYALNLVNNLISVGMLAKEGIIVSWKVLSDREAN